jgi:hypothetical protein
MVTRSHRDTLFAKGLPHGFRRVPCKNEAQNASLLWRGPNNPKTGRLGQFLDRIPQQFMLVRGDIVSPEASASPTTSAMFPVPASNLPGADWYTVSSKAMSWITLPPLCQG